MGWRFLKISRASVFYNVSVLTVSGVLFQLLGFVYQVILSRMAGAQALGVYRLVSPVLTVVLAATLSGLRLAVTSLSAGLRAGRDTGRLRALVRKSMLIFFRLFLVAAVPVGIFSRFIAEHVILEGRTAKALLLIPVYVFLIGFEWTFEALFLGIGKTKYTAVSNLLEQFSKIVLVSALLLWLGHSEDYGQVAFYIMLGMTLSEIPSVVWLLVSYRRRVLSQGGAQSAAGEEPLKILPLALPVSVSAVVTNLIASASVVILPGRLIASGLSSGEALSALGVVSEMALPLITLPMVLIRAMSSVLLPTISRSISQSNGADVRRKVQKSFQATGLFVLPATAILVPLAGPLSKILYRQELEPAYVLLLAIAAVFTYFEVIASSILNGLGMQRAGMLIMIVGEGIQLLCTYYLAALPNLGIYGYIIGMILSPLAVLLLSLEAIRYKTGCAPAFYDSFLLPMLAAGVTGMFARYFYVTFLPLFGGQLLPILAAAACSGGICIAIFLMAGLHPLRYYKTLTIPGTARGRGAGRK